MISALFGNLLFCTEIALYKGTSADSGQVTVNLSTIKEKWYLNSGDVVYEAHKKDPYKFVPTEESLAKLIKQAVFLSHMKAYLADLHPNSQKCLANAMALRQFFEKTGVLQQLDCPDTETETNPTEKRLLDFSSFRADTQKDFLSVCKRWSQCNPAVRGKEHTEEALKKEFLSRFLTAYAVGSSNTKVGRFYDSLKTDNQQTKNQKTVKVDADAKCQCIVM